MNRFVSGRATAAIALLGLSVLTVTAIAATGEIPVTTNSQSARMDFIAGQAALDRGDASQANSLFRAAVAADPDFTYGWFNLALASF